LGEEAAVPDESVRAQPPPSFAFSIGENLQLLVDRPDGTYCFRLHNDRVYYMSEKILKLAANISGDKLMSLGTCFGKFTKTHKFRLHITALDYLAPYAKVCELVPFCHGR
jgi:ribosome biogenesis protein Nip4